MSARRSRRANRSQRGAPGAGNRDEGAAYVFVLVLMIIAAMTVIPVMRQIVTVAKASKVVDEKTQRAEAVKGALRVALADPTAVYDTCAMGLTQAVQLASPGLRVPTSTRCYLYGTNAAVDDDALRIEVAAISTGAAFPAGIPTGGEDSSYANAASEQAWLAEVTVDSQPDRIWLPNLPAHGLNRRSATGYSMPAGFTACTVYFPGTYTDPVVITGSTPVFFTSGIYYFENEVRVSGSANVVVGDGGTTGCTTDQEAAFYATNAPSTHNISGLGATFVFGGGGRLVVDTLTAGSGPRLRFNQRYVLPTDTSTIASAGVSIASVNGTVDGSGVAGDLDVPGFLHVPLSSTGGSPAVAATTQGYVPSTLVAVPADPPPSTPATPIVEVNLTTAATVVLDIPGYTAVPQGVIKISTAPAAIANKTIRFDGGALAAVIEATPERPAVFALGVDNPVVQRVFKIVSETTSGLPKVTSTAIVQINKNGAYAVNAWAVQ